MSVTSPFYRKKILITPSTDESESIEKSGRGTLCFARYLLSIDESFWSPRFKISENKFEPESLREKSLHRLI